MGDNPVIPIQTCKLPSPRELTMNETRESLATWLHTAANFFARDDSFTRFLTPGQTWDRNAPHYGFPAEGQETRLRRTAPEVAAALLRFFDAVSSFFPFSFLSRKFPESTSWVTMKTIIMKVYNLELNGLSLLQFESMKRGQDENYYIFFERIQDYFRQHLAAPGLTVEGYVTGPNGDQFNLTFANVLTMLWMEKIDRRLLKLVQKEYSTQLMGGTQLISLVPRIANDMAGLLAKLEDGQVGRVQDGAIQALHNTADTDYNQDGAYSRDDIFFTASRGGLRGGSRGGNRRTGRDRGGGGFNRRDRGDRDNRGDRDGRGDRGDRGQLHCSHCQHLAREMKMRIPTDHSPLQCERRRVHVRLMGEGPPADENGASYQEDADPDGIWAQPLEEDEYGGPFQSPIARSNRSPLQSCTTRVPETGARDPVVSPVMTPMFLEGSLHRLCSQVPVSDLNIDQIGFLTRSLCRIAAAIPTRASSPRLFGDYKGKGFESVVDSGAELNCLDFELVRDMRIPFLPTNAGASVPGGDKIRLAGVTESDFIFHADFRGHRVPVNLQRAVVVHSLGVPAIVGEPAMQHNALGTSASKRTISIRYGGNVFVTPYVSPRRRDYQVARIRSSSTVYPGEGVHVPVPQTFSGENFLFLTRGSGQPVWFAPGCYSTKDGVVSLTNQSKEPVRLSKSKPVGEFRTCLEVRVQRQPGGRSSATTGQNEIEINLSGEQVQGNSIIREPKCGDKFKKLSTGRDGSLQSDGSQYKCQAQEEINLRRNQTQTGKKPSVARVKQEVSDGFRYRNFAEPRPEPSAEPNIDLDPDGTMPAEAKALMRRISNNFARVFTKAPGKYNGFYGKVDNSISLASQPTPNQKVYLPNYTEEMKRIQSDLMDKLMAYGVLQRPEDVGVTPEVVSPSLLVPKSEPGEYRLVTDFSSLNKHIRKYPSTSPTIAEAKNILARKRHFVHLDLSNYFFQSGLDRSDCQYLGTFHPYKGLLVYVVEPQGLKNASEHGYEVLGRVFGDMCRDGRLTRIADSIFPVGDSYEELAVNYEEALRRADLSGLTFKPGKVVICPRKTVLFGWELDGTEWKPTAHTTSALSTADRPTTVKGLRSFLGAFKQFTDCVPGYAKTLHRLEQLVGGRPSTERIEWTDENIKVFERAKVAAADIHGVHVPRPSDQLQTFSDYSAEHRAVGGRMLIIRTVDGKEVKLHAGYFSVILDKFKQNWVPCEGEAAGIRLTLQHFAPYIRESQNVTVHFTDNMPCVQAWRRCMQGQFSSSSRISTFLVNLSALSVELVYKPGKHLHSADYVSRHPQPCPVSSKCQICGFAQKWQLKGDDAAQLRGIEIKDILEGKVIMPYIQRKTWIGVQLNDSVLTQFKKLVELGQHPNKKKTGGDNTVLKRIYNQYQAGDIVIQNDGLVMAKSGNGHFNGHTIVVPVNIMPGIAFSLHVKLGHPSRGQLTSLMSRYFYCTGGTQIIHSVVDSCVQCRSVAQVPKAFAQDSTEKVETLGTNFSIDVIERRGQKIFLAREKLSQHTWLELIEDQTASTLRSAIVRTVLPWAHSSGAVIQCDGATALASLATEAQRDGSVLRDYGITLDIGRAHNVNKNPIAENAIRECEKEILRHKPDKKHLSAEDLVIIAKRMNERIRNRGVAAKEVLTRRDLMTNEPKNIQDGDLGEDQMQKRLKSNQQSQQRRQAADHPENVFHKGDIVYVKSQLSKHQPREQFIIMAFPEDMIQIQKLHSRLGSKSYLVYQHEVMSANTEQDKLYNDLKEQEFQRDLQETEEEQVQHTSPKSVEDVCPTKRPRGRPRKHPLSETRTETGDRTRPTRAAARQARDRLKMNPGLRRCEAGDQTEEQEVIYRPGIRPYKPDEDQFEMITGPLTPNPAHWWAFAPRANYGFMEEEDWQFPSWEEWVENRREALQPVLDPDSLQITIEEMMEQRSDQTSSSEDEFASPDSTLLEDREHQQRLAEFAVIARNPENPNQINTSRVGNFGDVLDQINRQQDLDRGQVQQQAAAESRPQRQRRLPERYRE